MSEAREIKVAIVEAGARARSALEALVDGTAGYAVAGCFDSVEDAHGKLDLHSPEVVVLGVQPGDGAATAIRRLADRYPALDVLVLSAPVGDAEVFASIRAGASGFLFRDTAPARLLEAIRELRDGGAPMVPTVARAMVRSFREPAPPPAPAVRLSQRETDTLRLLAAGHSYKTTAAELGVSVDTVRFHVRNIYAKLHVHSKVEAVLKATRDGLIP